MEVLSSTVEDLQVLLRSGRSDALEFLHAARAIFLYGLEGVYRPNIVLFGDALPSVPWNEAVSAAAACDCMLIVGTSQLVYPAASLPDIARSNGAHLVAIVQVRRLAEWELRRFIANKPAVTFKNIALSLSALAAVIGTWDAPGVILEVDVFFPSTLAAKPPPNLPSLMEVTGLTSE